MGCRVSECAWTRAFSKCTLACLCALEHMCTTSTSIQMIITGYHFREALLGCPSASVRRRLAEEEGTARLANAQNKGTRSEQPLPLMLSLLISRQVISKLSIPLYDFGACSSGLVSGDVASYRYDQ